MWSDVSPLVAKDDSDLATEGESTADSAVESATVSFMESGIGLPRLTFTGLFGDFSSLLFSSPRSFLFVTSAVEELLSLVVLT